MASSGQVDRYRTAPFLVKVFMRLGEFHSPEELVKRPRPNYIDIYTWRDCTLKELAHELAAHPLSIITSRKLGTRLVFRQIYGSSPTNAQRSAKTKDLGSVILWTGSPPTEDDGWDGVDESAKTLAECKYLPGDSISCAVLPPTEDTLQVQPASAVRESRAVDSRERARGKPLPPRDISGPSRRSKTIRESSSLFSRRPRGGESLTGGPQSSRPSSRYHDPPRQSRDSFPEGEWRRGEALPEPTPAAASQRNR